MANLREFTAAVIGSAMMIGGGYYLYNYYRERAFPLATTLQQQTDTLRIPTVAQMCTTLGSTEGDALKQCEADENAAGEYVMAWMNLNNFVINGAISLEQIQAIASLDDNSPLSGLSSDPSSGLDPGLGLDPSLGGDPTAGPPLTAGIDPVTGQPNGFLQSPAQLALYCLQMTGDWVTLHDCISENDPSSHIGGAQ